MGELASRKILDQGLLMTMLVMLPSTNSKGIHMSCAKCCIRAGLILELRIVKLSKLVN